MSGPRRPTRPSAKAAHDGGIARAYAHMDEESAARLRGEETTAERRLLDARDSLPDLPPLEGLEEPGEVPPVSGYDPRSESEMVKARGEKGWQVRAAFPDPESMCAAWGRVRRFEEEGGPIRPRGAVSQLRGLREIARHVDPDFDRSARPTPAQQCADEVEATPGFLDAEPSLRARYVRGAPWMGMLGETALWRFLNVLGERWPHGFSGEPDRPPPLRAEQIALIQAEVADSQRRPTKGRRKGRP